MRRALYLVHLYLGLSLGLLTVVLGLTGSLLVFRHEIDSALAPILLTVTPGRTRQPIPALVEAVNRAYPDDAIGTLNLPESREAAAEFWMRRGALRVYADPYTGRILGDRDADTSPMGWIFKVHTELFTGETGEKAAGFAGLTLVLLSLSGLFVWWPRKRQRFRDGLGVKRGASGKRLAYDLHRAAGFWASPFLALVGTTGAALVFPDQATALSHRLFSGAEAPKRPQADARGTPAPLAALVRAAQEAMPEGEFSRIVFPAKPREPIVLRKRTPNELHPNGMNYVFVDPVTARVLRVDRDTGERRAQTALNLRYPLHIGIYGGTATRVLHVAVGLTPAVLAVSGIVVWWNRRFRKKGRRGPAGDREIPEPLE